MYLRSTKSCCHNSNVSIWKIYEFTNPKARFPRNHPLVCHNGDTVCRTKNRIPRCTPQTITKFITKFSALTIKRSGQDTSYGARINKGTHFSTGPTTSSRHSNKKTVANMIQNTDK